MYATHGETEAKAVKSSAQDQAAKKKLGTLKSGLSTPKVMLLVFVP